MKMSLKWLRDYVAVDLGIEELEERLVLSGTAVETVEAVGTGSKKVFTGQILGIRPHPNADKLVLCDVTLGDKTNEIADTDQLEIVCGAKNMAAGDKVPVALIGGELPSGLVLEARKLRGVLSQGMLCSTTELGLGEDADGLMILPEDTELGITIDAALGLEDTVLELEITPNRPDCMSMLGMAREVRAIVGGDIDVPGAAVSEGPEEVEALADIEVRDVIRCPRYMARVIRGVKIGPSPDWMQARLSAAGMRPINNIVDITNFVMLETGQPLHAFDQHRLVGGKIIVRRADAGEKITTLDGVERSLTIEDLVIADGEKPMALAGVMGSAPAEVSEDTIDILLESAYFKPEEIMATARGLNLITESSARFERGTDPSMVEYACDRAAALMCELAGGLVSRGRVDIYPQVKLPWDVEFRTQRCRDIIGVDISDDEIAGFLQSLELSVRPGDQGKFLVTIPTFRRDLEREIDLIEEVARSFGYNNIPATMPRHSSEKGGYTDYQRRELSVRQLLMGLGLAEALSNTLVAERDFKALGVADDSEYMNLVSLRNPLGEEYAKLRSSLVPGLLTILKRNINWGAEGVSMFEIGRSFAPAREGAENPQPRETRRLTILMWGDASKARWNTQSRAFDLFDLKGVLEELWERMLATDLVASKLEHPLLHPGAAFKAAPLPGRKGGAGWAGRVHPSVAERFDVEGPVFMAALDLDVILNAQSPGVEYSGLPRYPGVSMDLSLELDEAVPSADVEKVIRKAGGELLADVTLFDTYSGDQISEGSKSLAFALLYRSFDRTLTDEEVQKVQARVVKKLAKQGIEVRSG